MSEIGQCDYIINTDRMKAVDIPFSPTFNDILMLISKIIATLAENER